MVTLSPQQQEAATRISKWLKSDESEFALAGYAGTGKTTIANQLVQEVEGSVIFAAYTGKAALAMRKRGVTSASTLHSLLYNPIINSKKEVIRLEGLLKETTDPVAKADLEAKLEAAKNLAGQPKFSVKDVSPIEDCSLVVVDEYSMLDEKIISDLREKAAKVLYLGDPAQLPPVKGKCPIKEDFFLTEVHRQALDNPILRAATMVREGKRPPDIEDDDRYYKTTAKALTWEDYRDADQILVGTNKVRSMINTRFRKKLYGDDVQPLPITGDKLVCLNNVKELDLYNGTIGYAESDAQEIDRELFSISYNNDGCIINELNVFSQPFLTQRDSKYLFGQNRVRMDYGYAITGHKSQGSEWDSVLIYAADLFGTRENRKQWLYTALTRAKEKVTLVMRPQ